MTRNIAWHAGKMMTNKHKNDVTKFDNDTERRLTRYIKNRNRRTGQTWIVVKRYVIPRGEWHDEWDRAIIGNECGERIRIFDRGTCWCAA